MQILTLYAAVTHACQIITDELGTPLTVLD